MQPTIARAYRVFQPYRLGDDFTGCEHCVSAERSRQLASIPLRELTVRDLDRYAFKAMTTWGTERHFKHFLPRLLELAHEDYLGFDLPEVLLSKLTYAKWQSWPASEREAVQACLDGFWLHQLYSPGDFPHDDRIETALGGLAAVFESLERFLVAWADQRAELPALHLAQLIDHSAEDVMVSRSIGLWRSPQPQCTEVVKWLASDKPLSLLNAFRGSVLQTFPLTFSQLDGLRAAVESR